MKILLYTGYGGAKIKSWLGRKQHLLAVSAGICGENWVCINILELSTLDMEDIRVNEADPSPDSPSSTVTTAEKSRIGYVLNEKFVEN
jgi:hypothetical protein